MTPEERKKHILICAKKLFSKNGYYKTQISDIIQEAKIARGTVYQYFKNKNEIFKTLLENSYQQWGTEVWIDVNKKDLSAMNANDYLRFRIKKTLQFFAKDRELCNILLRMSIGLREEFGSIMGRLEEKINKTIAQDLKLGIKMNFVKSDLNLELATELIEGGILKATYHYFVEKKSKPSPEEIDKIAIELENIISKGIFN